MKKFQTQFRRVHLPTLAVLFMFLGCKEGNNLKSDCIQGKYIDDYCEGIVIQILDGEDIGRNWESMFDKDV